MYSVICIYVLGLGGEGKLSIKQQKMKSNCEIGFILVSPAFWRCVLPWDFLCPEYPSASQLTTLIGAALSRQLTLNHE